MAVAQHTGSGAAHTTGTIYLLLFPIPVVLFLSALATDVAYSLSAFLMWLHFSEWLLAVGLAFGALAAVVLLVEFFVSDAIRAGTPGWSHLLLFFTALIVELLNALVHTIDGWTAVVPNGLVLSITGSVLALAAVGTLFAVPVRGVVYRSPRP